MIRAGLLLMALNAGAWASPIPHDRHDPHEVVPPKKIPEGMGEDEGEPWPVRLIVWPIRRGMFLPLPVVDTDPNRGVTMGMMPIWVIQHRSEERIEHIFAPSLTYNHIFQGNPTLRYYYYRTPQSQIVLRGSMAFLNDRELFGEYVDSDFLGRGMVAELQGQYNVDGSMRFFGIGPATPRSNETNYSLDVISYRAALGLPMFSKGSPWMFKFSHEMAGTKISNGPINSVPDLRARFPQLEPAHRHQISRFRWMLEYDTRDNEITTSRGSYAHIFIDGSRRGFGSEYLYHFYGADLRQFYRPSPESPFVTAGNVKFQQIVGDAPFWLMPQLGGKYIHRAYGDGRYIDNGLLVANIEERYTFYQVRMSGVTTEFELAPFVGVGTVFDTPGRMRSNYARPVYGAAIRAVARPQVVGSVDFGVGQEGLAAFMDINYSF